MKNILDQARNNFKKYIELVAKIVEGDLLLPPITLSELYCIKEAHQTLLMEYVHVIAGTSCFPFFMSQIRKVHLEKPITLKKLLALETAMRNPIRLITLRPLVTLLIETHIRKKLSELEIAYTQLKFIIPNNYYDKANYLEWLEQAKLDCLQLKDTVSSWKLVADTAKAILISIVGLMLAIFGVNSVYELIVNLATVTIKPEAYTLIIAVAGMLVIMLLYTVFFLENTFIAKRSIFLTVVNDKSIPSIYSLENHLFGLIRRRKAPEFALDYFISTVNNLIPILFFVWIASQVDKSHWIAPNSIYINCMWVIPVFFLINLFFQTILPWINRMMEQEA